MPNGRYEDFKIFESPVMTPLLANKFPTIKTYSAAGITNPNSVAKIDFDEWFSFSSIVEAKLAAEAFQVEIILNPASNNLRVT
jgi:hypothetical protein